MPEVVELHIRGVGGATAEEILEGPVTQVDGDDVAGFYKPRGGDGAKEAYEWGRLTSGTASRSIWWLLLPFTLFNVSGWMFRPRQGEQVEASRSLWLGRLLVLIGGAMITAMYVTWLAVLSAELVALDCGNVDDCRSRWYLAPLRWNGGAIHSRFLVGMALAWLLTVGLLWFIKGSQRTTERYAPPGVEPSENRLKRVDQLGDDSFWLTAAEHQRAFLAHLAGAIFVLGAIGSYGMVLLSDGNGFSIPIWLWLVCGALFAGGIVLLAGLEPTALLIHLAAAVLGILAGLVADAVLDLRAASRLDLTNGLRWFSGLPMTVALLILIVVAYRRLAGEPGGRRFPEPGFRWLGMAVAAGLSVYVLAAGFASLAHLIGRFLLGEDPVSELGYDETIVEMFGVALVLLVVTTVLAMALRSKIDGRQQVLADYADFWPGGAPDTDRVRSWVKKVEQKRWLARLPRDVDLRLTAVVIGILVLQLVQVGQAAADLIGDDHSFFDFDEWQAERFLSPLFGWDWFDWAHAAAASLIVLFVFPGLQLIRLMFSDRANRRQFGKVWDVMSFWPRRFHPLAAPCYAERSVPEFADRVAKHRDAGRRVSIVSHSQGTVIALAVIARLAREDEGRDDEAKRLPGVALTTYGSPLRRLYRNFFPRYFATDPPFETFKPLLYEFQGSPAWRSFWRPTDYIGQTVFAGDDSDPDDVRILDARKPLFPVNSHSDYEQEPQLIDWLAELRADMAT